MVSANKITNYVLMPGILPRLKAFFGDGFSFFASVLAVIYQNIGLLPRHHEYLRPESYGRFSIISVVSEAGRNLVFERKYADKIFIYFCILIGLLALVVQVILLFLAFLSLPAVASPLFENFSSALTGHAPTQDIAFVVLDHVFGFMERSGDVGGTSFFGSCMGDPNPLVQCTNILGQPIDLKPPSFPTPMHDALHGLLYFYSLGIMYIGVIIILYFVLTIIAETISSGTPFGTRFNRAWAIPRLLAFMALLAPITTTNNNAGINVAQLIVMQVAKYGSNLATNAWLLEFGDTGAGLGRVILGQDRSLLAEPNVPSAVGLTQFMSTVKMCMLAHKIIHGLEVHPYIVRPPIDDTNNVTLHTGQVVPRNEMGGTTEDYLSFYDDVNLLDSVTLFDGSNDNYPVFERAVIFSRYDTVVVRFGHRNPTVINDTTNPTGIDGLVGKSPTFLYPNNRFDSYEEHWAYVQPTCGELHFKINSVDPYVIGQNIAGPFIFGIQDNYFQAIYDYLGRVETASDWTVPCMLNAILPYDTNHDCVDLPYNVGDPLSSPTNPFDDIFVIDEETQWLTAVAARADLEFFDALNNEYIKGIGSDWQSYGDPTGTPYIYQNIETAIDDPGYISNANMTNLLRERGWAGAALWYNKIAEINGNVAAAVINQPIIFKYPKVMEDIAEQHKRISPNVDPDDRFNPRLPSGELAKLTRPGDQYIAAALYANFSVWQNANVQETVFTRSKSNIFLDMINTIFGTSGLMDLIANKGTHPLAMMSALGKQMVDASMFNLFIGVVGQTVGSLIANQFVGGEFLNVGGEVATTIAFATIGVGFILYYVLPILPFIYFFFGFGGWVKSIFEAVVAMPLWALAHIKIDGEGLPGPLATNGYFLLFEIFLRPILVIFGFVASMSLYVAFVDVLHDIYPTLTLATAGFDFRKEIASPTQLLEPNMTSISFWRNPVDQLFYTVLYAIIVYVIGLSCFKLIDQVPNNIMRWMGITVKTFTETAGDPASQLTGNIYRSSNMMNAQVNVLINRMKGRNVDGDPITDSQIINQ
ncbi:MAG: DotA/TraY family protein [Alphaproteobacteria bacterium]|nr:DotA/TraY family protein [Alphaproteobacteria bacterium]